MGEWFRERVPVGSDGWAVGVDRAVAASGEGGAEGRAAREAPTAADRGRDLLRGADRVCLAAVTEGLSALADGVVVFHLVARRRHCRGHPRRPARQSARCRRTRHRAERGPDRFTVGSVCRHSARGDQRVRCREVKGRKRSARTPSACFWRSTWSQRTSRTATSRSVRCCGPAWTTRACRRSGPIKASPDASWSGPVPSSAAS